MQDEQFAPLGLGAQRLPQAHRLPPGEDRGLLRRQVTTHRECGGGQENGIAVVRCIGHLDLGRQGAAAKGLIDKCNASSQHCNCLLV